MKGYKREERRREGEGVFDQLSPWVAQAGAECGIDTSGASRTHAREMKEETKELERPASEHEGGRQPRRPRGGEARRGRPKRWDPVTIRGASGAGGYSNGRLADFQLHLGELMG